MRVVMRRPTRRSSGRSYVIMCTEFIDNIQALGGPSVYLAPLNISVISRSKMGFREQINNSDYWPGFENPDHLDDLNEIADDAFKKNSIEGYLAALLIYHQLCEEMAKLLIEDSKFFIKASIYPAEIQFTKNNKTMFGRTIEQLKETIDFQEKDLFIKKCENFNQIRNSLAVDFKIVVA